MKKQISLKNFVFKITVLYWAIPILLIIILLSLYSNNRIKNSFLEEIKISINGAVEISENNLSFLIQESKKATYDEVIKSAYLKYKDNGEVVDLYRNTTNYLKNAYLYNSYIEETMLIYHDLKEEVYSVSGSNSKWSGNKTREFIEKNYDYIMKISSEIDTQFKFIVIENNLYLIRNLVDSGFNPFSILIFKVNSDNIFTSLRELPFSLGSSVMFLDEVYDIKNSEENLWNFDNIFGEKVNEISNEYYLYETALDVGNEPSHFRILIDIDVLKQSFFRLSILIITVVLLIFPIIIIISYVFYKQFSIPLASLVNFANKIENGELGYQIQRTAQSVEFGYLFEHLNRMSDSMKEQVEYIYKEQDALQKAKIKALQSQINPHFLNNTLEVINWEMRLGENQKAIEMIESLSTMLNASTSRNEQQLKSLKEEFIYVNAYLHIVKTRMGKRLNVVQEIDENIMDYKVPLLILQPIIENAIEHGIAGRSFGTITIRVFEKEKNIYIEVENDNVLSEKDKKRIYELLHWDENNQTSNIGHLSLGIRNVNERIKLIFGEEYCLTIEGTEESGTISRIILPK